MRIPSQNPDLDGFETVRALLERHLAQGTFPVPELPEIAVRIVESRESANAHQLADVIKSDRALTMYVLRIAASAPNRAVMPIVSLQHAVAWLGLDEVANMAFTLALQAKMLDVRGHQRMARRLWRHSLASALWSRQLALQLERETGLCYLCGLLHDIGKAVTLRASCDLAGLAARNLSSMQYHRLLEEFHRGVAACVVVRWQLPEPILAVATRWGAASAGAAARVECGIVDVARRLADSTVEGSALPTHDELAGSASFRNLGLDSQQAGLLLKSSADIVAELDRYLSP
jgi:HD-like signal output (HDOD) protein